jgi:hypothetical protein
MRLQFHLMGTRNPMGLRSGSEISPTGVGLISHPNQFHHGSYFFHPTQIQPIAIPSCRRCPNQALAFDASNLPRSDL